MALTRAEIARRKRQREKDAGLVKLADPITPEQRTEFKSVLKGESKVVKKKKGKKDADS